MMVIMKKADIPDRIWQDPRYFIAFGFGSGAIPFAPGTFGTLLAIPFYLILAKLSLFYYCFVLLILTWLAMRLCDQISKEIRFHDHPGMNIDEFIGYGFTMIGAPKNWLWIAIGFVLFRFFDIIKPQPIRWFDEHARGGFGMVFDDVLAGLFSLVILQILVLIARLI